MKKRIRIILKLNILFILIEKKYFYHYFIQIKLLNFFFFIYTLYIIANFA